MTGLEKSGNLVYGEYTDVEKIQLSIGNGQKLHPPAIPCWGLGVKGGNLVTDISLMAVGQELLQGFQEEIPRIFLPIPVALINL